MAGKATDEGKSYANDYEQEQRSIANKGGQSDHAVTSNDKKKTKKQGGAQMGEGTQHPPEGRGKQSR